MSKRFTIRCVFGFIVLLESFAPLYAGRGAETGEGVGYWKTHSVIFAEVSDVERLSREEYFSGTHRLQVQPLATLAGHFDSARMPNLELGAWLNNPIVTACKTVPSKGAFIVAVIFERDGEYFVSSSFLKFMPDGAGLIEVKGFSDPQVDTIRDNVQRVRSKLPF